MELKISLNNCFGIKKLETSFNYNQDNKDYVIYASNGTMKSSFSKTFFYYAEKRTDDIKDEIFTDRVSSCQITLDGNPIDGKSIFVVNPDDKIENESKISTFLASANLKNEYESLISDLNEEKKNFLKILKEKTQSSDVEKEFVNSFKENAEDDFFSCLKRNLSEISNDHQLYSFRYNDIFDSKGNVKKFLTANGASFQAYMNRYVELLSESSFFHKGDENTNSFGTYQADLILKSVEGNSFFRANHKMVLNDQREIKSKDELEQIIKNELNALNSDQQLRKLFDKIDKALSKNVELRAFHDVIENQRNLIPLLLDYENFKRDVWLGYLHSIEADALKLISLYEEKKEQLINIVNQAKQENERWKVRHHQHVWKHLGSLAR